MDDYEPLLVETTVIKSSESESIRPITVYQALQAERLPNEVQFSLDGAKFSKILLVTHVMLRFSDANGARGAYDLDDGTGRIYGSRSNKAGQDYSTFSAMIQQFDNSLACVMGSIIQRDGQQKIIEIESMTGAGYHQAMYHTLECMRTSLIIERHTARQAHDTDAEMFVVQEPRGNAGDSVAADSRASRSFFDLPQDDDSEAMDIGSPSPQIPVRPLAQDYYGDHFEGPSSASTSKQCVSQIPTTPPFALGEPETIVRVAHPSSYTVARTLSPLPPFGSSLQTNSHHSPQYYSQLAQLTATRLAIVSSLDQLQGDAIYGVWITDVYERVTQVIETTREEFSTDIEWLLEEIYIFRPLDDDRIALTPRASI